MPRKAALWRNRRQTPNSRPAGRPSPSVKDVIFDYETFSVSKANTKVEDTPVRTVIMGEVYLERKETGGAQKFLCLVGEKGKVLLTFFTTR